MNYEKGIQAVQEKIRSRYLDSLVESLRHNLRSESLFGPTESTRRERSLIIFELNRLAIKAGIGDFNSLCL